jgi:hypothetical protein
MLKGTKVEVSDPSESLATLYFSAIYKSYSGDFNAKFSLQLQIIIFNFMK